MSPSTSERRRNQIAGEFVGRILASLMKKYRVSEDQAMEAIHIGWLKMQGKNFDWQSSLSFWHRCSVNSLLTMLKKSGKYLLIEDAELIPIPEQEESRSEFPSIDFDKVKEELSEVDAEVLEMMEQNITNTEIAKAMNISEGNARIKKHRVIKKVKKIMGLVAMFIMVPLLLFAQSFELVRPADFRYYVTVDGDTVASRSLDYKAIQDAMYYQCQHPDALVRVEPVGIEARGCPIPDPEVIYIDDTEYIDVPTPYAVYEDMIRTVNWEHRQSVPDTHRVFIEVDHVADSLITWIEACGQMWQSGEDISCNNMARIFAEGIKGNRTVIVRDSVDLGAMNVFF